MRYVVTANNQLKNCKKFSKMGKKILVKYKSRMKVMRS